MIWLVDPSRPAPALAAVWLIATGTSPVTLPERSALRRGLGAQVLATQFGLTDRCATIDHDARGRPFVLAGTAHISLATRAGLVAVALAERPVGVDVEAVSDQPLPLGVLHAAEQEALHRLPEAERARAFARLWAAKEAYAKALGLGFSHAPESFSITDLGERFRVDDAGRAPAFGHLRETTNGGQVALAAAVIVLDRACRDQPG